MTGLECLTGRQFANFFIKDIFNKTLQRATRWEVTSRKVLFDEQVFSAKVKCAEARFTITARTTDLLAIFFYGTRQIPVNDIPDVFARQPRKLLGCDQPTRFVNTHAKGDSSNDGTNARVHKIVLHRLLFFNFHSSVEECSGKPFLDQVCCQLFRLLDVVSVRRMKRMR